MLQYKKMSLFDAPAGTLLVHGCNARGVWGRGIAVDFASKYPVAYKQYNLFCKMYENIGESAVGKTLITEYENHHNVGCLITSDGYGKFTDSPELIVINTVLALKDLVDRYEGPIYSNKFNSGLFNVPWQDTEKVLKVFVDKYKLEWVVCDPNMEN